MKKLLYVLTGLCLLAGLFTGCEKNPLEETGGSNGGSVSSGDGVTTIEGIVTSKDKGRPLLLASVTLLPTDKLTVTDTAGSFRFRDIAAGTYKLQVKRTGYAPYTSGEIKVAAGKTVRYNIALATEQSDLQIQNTYGTVIDELVIDDYYTEGVFVLKNTGTKIIEWEIPKLAVDWISDFSLQSGKLAPGASERVEFSIDRSKLSNGTNETTLYIGSSVGDKELLIKVGVERSFCLTDESGEELLEVDMSGTAQYRFQIKNTGKDALTWRAIEAEADWLTIMGETEGKLEVWETTSLTLKADLTHLLEEGTYETTLVFRSNAGEKTLPVKIKIEMGIRLENTDGAEISELDLGYNLGGTFYITNTGTGLLEYTISCNKDWLALVGEKTGTVRLNASARVELQIDWTKLPEGTNEATVHIGSTGGDRQLPVRVSKYVVVGTVGSDYVETALGLNMKMIAVEGGTFQMGATEEQGNDAFDREKPVHRVALDGFYIGATEVTQAQWTAVMGTFVYQQQYKADGYNEGLKGVGDNYPMYYVSWDEAVEFCQKLSEITGKTYRLPTEAEWEYAARGGQQADGTKYAGSNTIGNVAWYKGNSSETTHPVGTKAANELGIYDMSGNVNEWCSDWHSIYYYSSSPFVNPQGPAEGGYRQPRGGSWSNSADLCRVSYRSYGTPVYRSGDLGFRVACSSK